MDKYMTENQRSGNAWIIVIIVLASGLVAQGAITQSEQNTHHDHTSEIGLSVGYTYLDGEDESAPGLHLHLMRRLPGEGLQRHFSVGLGVETIFAAHQHFGVMGSVAVYPWRSLVLTASPGVVFADHDGEWENEYATHVEASYGFEWRNFEVGPAIGFSQAVNDRHYMLGVHIGSGF